MSLHTEKTRKKVQSKNQKSNKVIHSSNTEAPWNYLWSWYQYNVKFSSGNVLEAQGFIYFFCIFFFRLDLKRKYVYGDSAM